jgi:lysine N6-hydroxylase
VSGQEDPRAEVRERDLVAIGCGPFNLGLAALASTLPELAFEAFEAQPELRWHPGMMFTDATLQLSFLADLVTLIDPTNPLSFLAYLRDRDRMYAFFIREQFHPTRREYEDYLRWVASKLTTIRFAHRVSALSWDAERQRFLLSVEPAQGVPFVVAAKHVVMGIGTEGALPAALRGLPRERVLHSSEYLLRKREVLDAGHVTVIGSGQSGAEIALDLFRHNVDGGPPVSWLTRTRSFAPLDYSKLVLEMTTPEYIRYFHALPQPVRDQLVAEQWQHYKGISVETIEALHDLLYHRCFEQDLAPVELRNGIAVEAAQIVVEDGAESLELLCRHRDTQALFAHRTSLVVAATGYRERVPQFLAGLEPLIARDEQQRLRIRLDYSVELDDAVTGGLFVANAELHTHGVATPDLGVCAFRNATILNKVLGREVYRLPQRTAYSTFAPPAGRS